MEPQKNHSTSNSNHSESTKKNAVSAFLIVACVTYLSLTLFLIALFFPAIQEMGLHLVAKLSFSEVMAFFVTSLSFAFSLVYILYSIHKRKHNINKDNNNSSESIDSDFYGKYSSERDYLEKQLSILNQRLTYSEDNWRKINHLILSGNSNSRFPNSLLSPDTFLKDFGISLDEIEVDRHSAFILTPYNQQFAIDCSVIIDVCGSCGIRSTRADEKDLNYGSNNMLGHIVRHILSAGVIIANISNRNPNVFYELGLAHMIGKPTILICAKDQNVPFDILQRYVVFYSTPEELASKLRNELIRIYIGDSNSK